MDLSLANIDLDENPYAGTEHDTNKSLRDFALERIIARRENRSQLAQIAWDMRRAVGPDGFYPELRKAVQAFIKFDVESAGGPGRGQRKAELGSHSGQNRSGRRNHPQRRPRTDNGHRSMS
jgi:hypothetical protein